MINLKEITKDNWRECVRLKVADDQQNFVSPNWYSILEASFDPGFLPLAVYDDGVMVGFVMYGYSNDDKNYWIDRLMISRDYQRKGYGRVVMEQVLGRLRQIPDCKQVFISYDPPNQVARKLYASLGFEETGELLHDETVARLII